MLYVMNKSVQDEEYLVSGTMDSIPSINRPANGEGLPEFNTLDEPIRQTIVTIPLFTFLIILN